MRSLIILLVVLGSSLPALGHGGIYRGPANELPPTLGGPGGRLPAVGRSGVQTRSLRDFWLTELETRGRDSGGSFVSVRADGAPSDGTLLARLDAAEDPAGRRKAIVAIGLSARPTTEVIGRVCAIVADPETDDGERKLAALALGAIGGRSGTPDRRIARTLRERFDSDESTEKFRAHVVLAMGLSGDASHLVSFVTCIDAVCKKATSVTNLLASNSVVAMTRLVERHPSLVEKVLAQLERALGSGCGETRRSASIAVGRIGSLATLSVEERTAFVGVAQRIIERPDPRESQLGLLALGRIGATTTSTDERDRIATKLIAVVAGDDARASGYAALALASVAQVDEGIRRTAKERLHAGFTNEDIKPSDVAVLMVALALIGDRRIEGPTHGWLADLESPAILRGQGRLALKLLDGRVATRSVAGVPIARLVRDAAFLNPMPMLDEYRQAIETE